MKYGNNKQAWLYLLPAIAFLGLFMVYPLIDVVVYSFEESFNFASQTYSGVGLYNFSYVLRDPYFLQAIKNTFILVIITVPLSTGIALLISLGLNSIKKLRDLYQTVFFQRFQLDRKRGAGFPSDVKFLFQFEHAADLGITVFEIEQTHLPAVLVVECHDLWHDLAHLCKKRLVLYNHRLAVIS